MATEPSEQEPDGLPDEALVVRGGRMTGVDQIASAARTNRDDYVEGLCMSVFAATDLDLEGIIRGARSHGRYLPHGQVHTSTAGRIRAAGAELLSTPPPPGHYSLIFPEDTDAVYAAVIGAFDDAVETPQGRMRNV